jgi:hypothetical protein
VLRDGLCEADLPSPVELSAWATETEQYGTFTNAQGWNMKLEVEAFETGRIGGGQKSDKSKLVLAKRGKRVEIPGCAKMMSTSTQEIFLARS